MVAVNDLIDAFSKNEHLLSRTTTAASLLEVVLNALCNKYPLFNRCLHPPTVRDNSLCLMINQTSQIFPSHYTLTSNHRLVNRVEWL